ncbi:MAG: MFS transporter [Mogibacterium sp.]|nr:MFS transporter [Mogibacterium sp.]
MSYETQKKRNFIALLAAYFAANVIFIMSPAINAMATGMFADKSYTAVLLVSTISSLCMIPGSLVAGPILNKIGFKKLAIISMGGIAIFGAACAFTNNLYVIYVLRGIVGFCIGLGFPLQGTMSLQLFNDAERPKYLGWATVSLAVGSVFYMIVSGYLADHDARYSFLLHLITLVPLAVVLIFLKQPTAEEIAANNAESPSRVPEHGKLPGYAIFTAAMFAFIFFTDYTVLLNMSSICAYEHIGGATVAGALLSVYCIGNMCGGFLFNPLSKKTGGFVVPVGLILWIAGMGMVAFGHSVPSIVIGVLLNGTAVQTVWPGTVNSYSTYVPRDKQSLAVGVFVAGMNIGCFLTTYFIQAVMNFTGSDSPRVPVQYGFVFVAIAGIIWAIVEVGRARKAAK